ncbi:hypothetical protein GCM10010282_10590 [Streptomyces roseolus]|nr:hypothetical protein GCM10010282_10590 [Streptomyces roseolus]
MIAVAGTPERPASWEIRIVLMNPTVNLRPGSKVKAAAVEEPT